MQILKNFSTSLFRAAFGAAFGLLFLLLPAAGAAGQSSAIAADSGTGLAVLYIEANTGDSSGGHAGIRIGNQAFHYQYGDQGRLVLKRESWEEFRSFYNDLGNRTIHAARLDLPAATRDRIHDHFTMELLRQDTRHQRLDAARARVRLLTALAAGRPLPRDLRAAGFFRPEKGSGGPAADRLKKAVSERLGADFFSRRRRQLLESLSQPPDTLEEFINWQERRSLLTALEIIDRKRGLDSHCLVAVPAADGREGLDRREQKRLRKIAQEFRETIIKLLTSRRPDRGFPLLLATARYLACNRSLRENRLLLLNACPPQAETIDPLYQAGSQELLALLTRRSRREAARRRQRFFQRPGKFSEFFWCRLENAATRYTELEAAVSGRLSLRIYPGNAIPARPGSGFSAVPFPPAAAQSRLPAARAELARLESRYDRDFGYNLFSRNCVTELFATLARALPLVDDHGSNPAGFDQRERKVINSISFIPWRMFDEVEKGLHPAAVTVYPSLRRRFLSARYRQDPALLVYLKECNTLTSSLYRAGGQDNAFLLFTDEAGPARPLYGIINLAWALPRAAFGLLSWPFDHGRELKKGFYGTLFSLPELFFVNLRKGSFVIVPTPEAAAGNETAAGPQLPAIGKAPTKQDHHARKS